MVRRSVLVFKVHFALMKCRICAFLLLIIVIVDSPFVPMRIILKAAWQIIFSRVDGGVIRDPAESPGQKTHHNSATERRIVNDPGTAIGIHQTVLGDFFRRRLQANHRVCLTDHLVVVNLIAVTVFFEVSVAGGTVDLSPPITRQQLLAESRTDWAQKGGHQHIMAHVENLTAGRFVGIIAC